MHTLIYFNDCPSLQATIIISAGDKNQIQTKFLCFVFIFISCCNLKREEASLSILSLNGNNNKNRNKDISYLVFSHWLMQWKKRLWEKSKMLKCRIQSNNSKCNFIFFFIHSVKLSFSTYNLFFHFWENDENEIAFYILVTFKMNEK